MSFTHKPSPYILLTIIIKMQHKMKLGFHIALRVAGIQGQYLPLPYIDLVVYIQIKLQSVFLDKHYQAWIFQFLVNVLKSTGGKNSSAKFVIFSDIKFILNITLVWIYLLFVMHCIFICPALTIVGNYL